MLLFLLNSYTAFLYAAIGDAAKVAEPGAGAGAAAEVPPGAALMGSFILGLLVASIWAWGWFISRKIAGKPVLSPADRPPLPPWGLVDLIVAFAALLFASLLVGLAIRLLGFADLFHAERKPLPLIAIEQLSTLLAVVIVTVWLAVSLRGGAAAWSPRHLKRDLLLGGMAYLLMAPVLFSVMLALTELSGIEYDHPVIEVFDASPLTILSGYFVTVVVASLAEEFVFRVLLQGYLQSIAAGGPLLATTILLGRGRNPAAQRVTAPDASGAVGGSEGVRSDEGDGADGSADLSTGSQPWWPVIVTGVLFGLAHYGYGVSWIPLVLFGWALGWLYRHTGRIWPCVAAHACSNAFAVTMMSLDAVYGLSRS